MSKKKNKKRFNYSYDNRKEDIVIIDYNQNTSEKEKNKAHEKENNLTTEEETPIKDNINYVNNESLVKIETYNEEDFIDWKKIEIEILRDSNGNCICIGSREFINVEISVVPVLTIPNKIFQLLRYESIKISNEVKNIGNINLVFAINPINFEYKLLKYTLNYKNTLIEKITKYPMEEVLFEVYVGKYLDNITVGDIKAFQEPIITEIGLNISGIYTVCANNLEKCILKASCMSKGMGECFRLEGLIEKEKNEIEEILKDSYSEIFFVIAEAIRKEISVERISEITKIDKFFIGSVYKIIKLEKELTLNYISYKLVYKALNIGLSPNTIALLSGKDEKSIEKIISKNSI